MVQATIDLYNCIEQSMRKPVGTLRELAERPGVPGDKSRDSPHDDMDVPRVVLRQGAYRGSAALNLPEFIPDSLELRNEQRIRADVGSGRVGEHGSDWSRRKMGQAKDTSKFGFQLVDRQAGILRLRRHKPIVLHNFPAG